MDGREIFLGNFLQAIDAKGRVAIPSDLRGIMERNSPEKVIVVSIHDTKPCMIGYDRGYARLRYDELKQRQAEDRAAGRPIEDEDAAFETFGVAEVLNYDASGRFVMPGFHREEAGIGSWAYFKSNGDHFQIWDPRRLLEESDMKPVAKRQLAYEFRQRGVEL